MTTKIVDTKTRPVVQICAKIVKGCIGGLLFIDEMESKILDLDQMKSAEW